MAATFTELAGLVPSAEIDGRSLVPFLRGQKPANWRTVALIEHRGPVRNLVDPDLPGPRSGNPPTYEAIRGASFLYAEYANGEKEYHDLVSDPDELHNTFAAYRLRGKPSCTRCSRLSRPVTASRVARPQRAAAAARRRGEPGGWVANPPPRCRDIDRDIDP